MAISSFYGSAALYRSVADKDDQSENTEIEGDLTAVSRYLDRMLGRFFTKDASAVIRLFYSAAGGAINPEAENPWKGLPRSRLLAVDDMAAAPTKIRVDESRNNTFSRTLSASDYQLMPLNADKGPEAWPWNQLYLPAYSSLLGWPGDTQVEITAQWGWAAIPKPIEIGACHLTALLRLETPRSVTSRSDVGDILGASREAQGIISDLARQYKRITL